MNRERDDRGCPAANVPHRLGVTRERVTEAAAIVASRQGRA